MHSALEVILIRSRFLYKVRKNGKYQRTSFFYETLT